MRCVSMSDPHSEDRSCLSGRPLRFIICVLIFSLLQLYLANPAAAATEIILDNAKIGVNDTTGGRTFTGRWCGSSAAGKYGAESFYSCGASRDTYRWTPNITAAQSYDVYIWWPNHPGRASAVPVSVVHGTGTTAKTFNEKTGGGQWVLHGRYAFKVGKLGYVEVNDAGGQAGADAVRFVPVAGGGGGGGGGTNTTTQKDAARLMVQATYGPTLTGIDAIAAKGPAAWIDEQLALPSTYSHLKYQQERVAKVASDDHQGILQESIWQQAIKGNDQLRQRVAFAWSEIFVISSFRIFDAQGVGAYMDVLTKNAFANYRTLLEAVTLNQAMGIYLDMLRSDKEDAASGRMPNENYPREVLQLFSVGLDELNQDGSVKLDGAGKAIPTYDQDVVLGFAKAFSGWSYGAAPLDDNGFYNYYVDPKLPAYLNYWSTPMKAFPGHHSTGTKLLLRGATLPAGQIAEKDLKDALDNIFNHPNVGPFIGKQLIQRLVTSNPTPGYISRVAGVFNNNGAGVRGDMKAVIKAILMDNEARSPTVAAGAQFGKQREPLLRFGNLLRAFNATSPSGRFGLWSLDSLEFGMNQSFFRSPSVFNFFAPDYAPQGPIADAKLVAPEFQITTDTQIVTSSNQLRSLIFYPPYGFPNEARITLNFANVQSLASDPAKLVDKLDLLMTAGNLSPATSTAVITAVAAFPVAQLKERTEAAIFLITVSPDFVIQK
jgi:uncharacterized protein (DUF1800 family)